MRGRSWILVPILVAGCAGGSDDRETKKAAPKSRSTTPAVERQARGAEPAGRRAARAKKKSPSAGHSRAKKQKPQRRQRALPWRQNGMSLVAHVKTRRIAVYKTPRAKRPMLVLKKRDPRGTQRAFLVRSMRRKWVRVYLPTRPNGSLGWVKRRSVRTYTNGYRLVVRLRSNKLNVWRGRRLLASYSVAAGTSSTPTPRGVFYVVELLKPQRPTGAYGPYSFGLSAHSTVLKRFAGGDGRVGLHGTNQPGLIGADVSHGCIRVRNTPIRRLAKILPLGTPVHIRS